MLCAYNINEFSSLPHYRQAKSQVRSNAVKTAIDELGNVIVSHGFQVEVGVCLLHKHFEINNDEILLETVFQNTSKLSPISHKTIQGEVLAYMWKLNNNKTWSPLEFTYSTKPMQDAFEKVMKNEAFLQTIGETMMKLQVNDILGLSLLHRSHISGLRGGTIETTDESGRELTVAPLEKATKCDHHETVQTLWKFGIGQTGEDICNHCMHCTHKDSSSGNGFM